MLISKLFEKIPGFIQHGVDQEIFHLSIDTRDEFSDGTLFVALPGVKTDGHHYIDQAIQQGAIAIVCERLPDQFSDSVTYIELPDILTWAGNIASVLHGNPSESLKVIGVTGTNGKTTVATALHQALENLNNPTGLISTIGNKILGKSIPATHTTPNALEVHRLFREMVDAGCTHVTMEVSSHALEQYRTAGVDFDIAIFTNLTQDHLDYHGTMKDYASSKKKFFDTLSSDAVAITNIDDDYGVYMVQNTQAKVISYGRKHTEILSASCISIPENYMFEIADMNINKSVLVINDHEIISPFIGTFNGYNVTALYSTLRELGYEAADVADTIGNLEAPSGRLEIIQDIENRITGIIDYAHTPDALLNVLKTLKEIPHNQIITVIGCGGDRDKGKRPQMANIAQDYSDFTIFTNDNPRTEDPQDIINDMVSGIETGKEDYEVIFDRKTAIKHAVGHAKSDDIILIAGKGHEDYQIIGNDKVYFSDQETLREYLV